MRFWRWLTRPVWRRWYAAGFADGASEALGVAVKALEDLPGADAVRAELAARKARVDLDIKTGLAAEARKEST
jgi:hypothetical protein